MELEWCPVGRWGVPEGGKGGWLGAVASGAREGRQDTEEMSRICTRARDEHSEIKRESSVTEVGGKEPVKDYSNMLNIISGEDWTVPTKTYRRIKENMILYMMQYFEFCWDTAFQISVFLTSWYTSPSNLPKDESKTVHVGHNVRLEVISIQAFIQHFRGHIALGANSCVGWYVNFICITRKKPKQGIYQH